MNFSCKLFTNLHKHYRECNKITKKNVVTLNMTTLYYCYQILQIINIKINMTMLENGNKITFLARKHTDDGTMNDLLEIYGNFCWHRLCNFEGWIFLISVYWNSIWFESFHAGKFKFSIFRIDFVDNALRTLLKFLVLEKSTYFKLQSFYRFLKHV